MSRQDARRTLIAYDVPDDARRTKIAHLLEKYGDRIQYSVFLAELGAARLLRMRADLLRTMDRAEDSILVCDLGRADGSSSRQLEQLGSGRDITGKSSFIV